ncbi:tRNA threonylcarbamoyladenosine dehydratase [Rhizobacter sp. J219]|uniref:tRNA threonylcarbamoyladenosine dehydratase n=1 Tax=Rhizobacter sp. J219 TaxID=2898430 RepID=UPI002151AE09|nr:tRNA threonylcarbamoyladenosine dehydratase [Rhizobacter sp. J219]MCR5883054.1 tRNA threonylcarbamoyladenosine dehydratase [Rhizobacter sp. J219]
MNAPADLLAPDLERRFGGLRRLHGDAGYTAMRAARVGVVGLGGVGSWAVEALARSGVAQLTLFDMDHVAESNVNRQVQALGDTLGQHKGEALRARIADIHPGCDVQVVDDFVTADNWPALLPREVDVLIDACDQVQAKMAMAVWAREGRHDFVCVGAAGGKQKPQLVEVDDISRATHDPLLASMRQRLRKQHGAPRDRAMGVRCVFSREAVAAPVDAACDAVDGSLNCHGYGSSVVVTATFGLVTASEALQCVLRRLA